MAAAKKKMLKLFLTAFHLICISNNKIKPANYLIQSTLTFFTLKCSSEKSEYGLSIRKKIGEKF